MTVLEQDDDDDSGMATTMGNVHINTTTTTGTTPTATTMSQEQLQQMIDPSDAPRDTLRGNSFSPHHHCTSSFTLIIITLTLFLT